MIANHASLCPDTLRHHTDDHVRRRDKAAILRRKRIARWWTVGIALGALLIGAGVSANSAAAGTAPASGDSAAAIASAWAYVPEYLSAPVIESGVVVDHAGHPVPGAIVVLFPVPRNPANGTTIAPLARGATAANGRYELHLPATLDSALANKWTRGALNLHIMVFYPNTAGGWFVPIPAGQRVAAAAKIVLKPEADTYSATVPANSPIGSCTTDSKPTTIAPVKQIVGYKSSLDPKLISAEFSYSTGYTVTTGVGFSANGSKGGISASGSTTTSDTETVTYRPIKGAGSNYYEADSVWTWQKYQCFHPGGHGGGYWSYAWYLLEDAVGGSAGTPGAPAVKAGYCFSSKGLASVTEDHSTEKTWTQGASLKAFGYGIDLSSQDGYTTEASLTYNFRAGDYPAYCGVGGYPGTAKAGYVQVHK